MQIALRLRGTDLPKENTMRAHVKSPLLRIKIIAFIALPEFGAQPKIYTPLGGEKMN